MHQNYTMAFSSNTNLIFEIVLKIAGFYVSFSSIFKIIFHTFLCCFQNSCFESVIHSRKLNAYCHVPNYDGVKFHFYSCRLKTCIFTENKLFYNTRSSTARRCFGKYVILEISQNSRVSNCAYSLELIKGLQLY